MVNKNIRLIMAVIVVFGIALLAGGKSVWAESKSVDSPAVALQNEPSVVLAKPGPGSVQPPPKKGSFCQNGLYSIGGVVTLDIQDLQPGYCVEAELWNPIFQFKRIPEEAGKVLAYDLFIKIYYHGRLVYEVLPGDGIIEACYAIPPEKQAQFYFYDFFGKRFDKRTEEPLTWDPFETVIDNDNKVACAFTQTSGVYALVGK